MHGPFVLIRERHPEKLTESTSIGKDNLHAEKKLTQRRKNARENRTPEGGGDHADYPKVPLVLCAFAPLRELARR
jgi:hypothetical protein